MTEECCQVFEPEFAEPHHRKLHSDLSHALSENEKLKEENGQLREYAKEKLVPTTYVQMVRCDCKDKSHGVVGCPSARGHFTDSGKCQTCSLIHSGSPPFFL